MELSIAIAHHHRLLREALAFGLSQNAFPVIHQAYDVEQLSVDIDTLPDVVLAEAICPLDKFLERLSRFRCIAPECKVIMLDVPNDDEMILACVEIGGISGYVVADSSLGDVIRTVRAIGDGETICSPHLANLAFSRISVLASQISNARTSETSCLTRREQDIMEVIERGLSNKEIASALKIEISTVKNHIHNILDKLHLKDRRSAARYAKEHGFVARYRSYFS